MTLHKFIVIQAIGLTVGKFTFLGWFVVVLLYLGRWLAPGLLSTNSWNALQKLMFDLSLLGIILWLSLVFIGTAVRHSEMKASVRSE